MRFTLTDLDNYQAYLNRRAAERTRLRNVQRLMRAKQWARLRAKLRRAR